MRLLVFSLIAACTAVTAANGQSRNISGVVIDAGSKEAIPGAGIYWIKDTTTFKKKKQYRSKYTGFSNAEGTFDITIPEKCLQKHPFIGISAIGFLPQVIPILDQENPTIIAKLFCKKNIVDSMHKMIVAKPAIYLYPTVETIIHIRHEFKGSLRTTYPEYHDSWDVRAGPDGSLYNLRDKRSYEYLFWDGICAFPKQHFQFKEGFVVAQSEIAAFLQQKLEYIGLNNKEINDFIVYWLPLLNQNERNFIHFRINDDIDHSSVLHVNPEPDSWIRVFMEFNAVDSNFSIPEQQLKSCPRNKFTLVEWGGGKIEDGNLKIK